MATIVSLTPLTDRGVVILDVLERRAGQQPFEVDEDSGERTYHLRGEQAESDAFDTMLETIARDWRDHLNRN
jgi:hypothetical protein